jgi:hypothetical protein
VLGEQFVLLAASKHVDAYTAHAIERRWRLALQSSEQKGDGCT